jgi:hypothetical protein
MLPKNVSRFKLPYHCPPFHGHVIRIYFKFLAFVALNLKMPTISAIEYMSTITDAQANKESMEKNIHFESCICVCQRRKICCMRTDMKEMRKIYL